MWCYFNMKTLFFCLSLCLLQAQNPTVTFQKISEKELLADQWFGQDKFGFEYFAINNEFYKQKDNQQWVFKQIGMGKICRVDLQNPLRILLFYEPFNTVVTLDNQLNEILTTNFNFQDNIVAFAIGLANGDRYWVFNTKNQQLGMFNYFNGQYRVFPNYISSPIKKYQSNFNHFSWINEDNEWWQSDIFGRFTKLQSNIQADEVFFLNHNFLLAKHQNQYLLLSPQNQTILPLTLDKNITHLQYNNQILTIFTHQKIIKYQFKIN